VALHVLDAVPLDGRWLAVMVENLERDEQVAGVYGRQVPSRGSRPPYAGPGEQPGDRRTRAPGSRRPAGRSATAGCPRQSAGASPPSTTAALACAARFGRRCPSNGRTLRRTCGGESGRSRRATKRCTSRARLARSRLRVRVAAPFRGPTRPLGALRAQVGAEPGGILPTVPRSSLDRYRLLRQGEGVAKKVLRPIPYAGLHRHLSKGI